MLSSAFSPQGPTVSVTSASAVQANASFAGGNATAYRIRNLNASTQGYIAWGGSSLAAPTGPGTNTVGMLPNSVEVFSVPPQSYFRADAASTFEVTPGEGV